MWKMVQTISTTHPGRPHGAQTWRIHFPRAGQLARRLVATGIDPASRTDVALTHSPMDHIGGCSSTGWDGEWHHGFDHDHDPEPRNSVPSPESTRTVRPPLRTMLVTGPDEVAVLDRAR
jgi:hypothetical protein